MATPVSGWLERDVVVCRGPDAIDFVSGQFSADVATLAAGESSNSFLLDPDGKVVAWGQLLRAGPEQVSFVVAAGFGDRVMERLNRFKLRVAAELELSAGVAVLGLRGPGSLRTAGELGGLVVDRHWPGADAEAVDVVGPEVEVRHAVVEDPGGFEAARISAGVPELGVDLRAGDIPAEAGRWAIESSVSFTKGCYVGQELVARIDSRGSKVPRRNCRIRVEPAVETGAVVTLEGEVVGEVTSVSGRDALARLSRRAEAGSVVEVSGTTATVVEDLGA